MWKVTENAVLGEFSCITTIILMVNSWFSLQPKHHRPYCWGKTKTILHWIQHSLINSYRLFLVILYHLKVNYVLVNHYRGCWHVNHLMKTIPMQMPPFHFYLKRIWNENLFVFIFSAVQPDSLDLFPELVLLMLQPNLYQKPLFFGLSTWLMQTALPRSLSFIFPGCFRKLGSPVHWVWTCAECTTAKRLA